MIHMVLVLTLLMVTLATACRDGEKSGVDAGRGTDTGTGTGGDTDLDAGCSDKCGDNTGGLGDCLANDLLHPSQITVTSSWFGDGSGSPEVWIAACAGQPGLHCHVEVANEQYPEYGEWSIVAVVSTSEAFDAAIGADGWLSQIPVTDWSAERLVVVERQIETEDCPCFTYSTENEIRETADGGVDLGVCFVTSGDPSCCGSDTATSTMYEIASRAAFVVPVGEDPTVCLQRVFCPQGNGRKR
jgi:hypothetical protein